MLYRIRILGRYAYAGLKNLTHHPKAQIKRGTKDTSPPAERSNPKGTFPDYGTIVKRTPDPAWRAKKAKNREFVLSFLKTHGIE